MSDLIEVCSLNNLQRSPYQIVDVGGMQVAVYYHDGAVYAFEDKCTHQPCPLSGSNIEGNEIICAMHGARFNIKSGEVTMQPAQKDLRMFNTQITEGVVFICGEHNEHQKT